MSIYRSLPENPSLEQLKQQARELLRALAKREPAALERLTSSHPRSAEVLAREPKLSDAQLVLAREYEFPSWPALHELVEAGLGEQRAELLRALEARDVARVRALLDAYPRLIAARFAPNNDTALHLAAKANQLELAELLLERGADHAALNSWRGTPLVGALISGQRAMAELLLARGARPTTLAEAAGLGDLALMSGFWDDSGALKPEAGVRFGHELEPGVWRIDQAAAFDPASALHDGLEYACRNGWREAAEFMLERGADLHRAGFFGAQPLHWAAGNGQNELVRLLVQRGADMTRQDPTFNGTAYGWAREFGHAATMQLLLELGYQPTEQEAAAPAASPQGSA